MKVLLHIYKNALNFDGRASRREALYFIGLELLVGGTLMWIDAHNDWVNPEWGVGPCLAIFLVLNFLPGLTCTVRRLHDWDRSGWWWLLTLIPLLGRLVVFAMMWVPGTDGENTYGPPPQRI